jgi:hypothetical protein
MDHTAFSVFLDVVTDGSHVDFFIDISKPIRQNTNGGFILTVLPSAFALTRSARLCMSVDRASREKGRRYVPSIGVHRVLNAIRADCTRFVDRIMSFVLREPFTPTDMTLAAAIFGVGIPAFNRKAVYLRYGDKLDRNRSCFRYVEHAGWNPTNSSLENWLPYVDSQTSPKRLSDQSTAVVRFFSLRFLLSEETIREVTRAFVLAQMQWHSKAVNDEQRAARLDRFMLQNADAIANLRNPGAELRFDAREEFENLDLEAWCMVKTASGKDSMWSNLPSEVIDLIGRMHL